MILNSLSLHTVAELSDALRVLKSYVHASKQIGNKAVLSDPKNPTVTPIRIEYPETSDESSMTEYSDHILKVFYPETNPEVPRLYAKNPRITGGIRLFFGDDMIDISFDKFAHIMKQSHHTY